MDKEIKKNTKPVKKVSSKKVEDLKKETNKVASQIKKDAEKAKKTVKKSATTAKRKAAIKVKKAEIETEIKAAKTKRNINKKVNDIKEEIADAKEQSLNKLNEIKDDAKKDINEVIEEKLDVQKCKYCHKYFDKGLTVCPHCRKNQQINTVSLITSTLIVLFILLLVFTYFFMNKQINKITPEEYKSTCVIVSYEDLIRSPKNTLNKAVKLIGKVVSVEGHDNGITGNTMTITLNINLFDTGTEQLVKVVFTDKNYSQGFLKDDLIEVYGMYTEINGNMPTIIAEYIDFGN